MNSNIKNYVIISPIYNGKRSIIYQALKTTDEQPVTIKVNNKEKLDAKDRRRLQGEFELGRRIDSQAVIKYLEVIHYDTGIAVVEEYFSGTSLATLMKYHVFTLREFLKIAIGICSGLEKIHSQNIVHQAIQPGNILYRDTDQRVKIIDFSTAAYLEETAHKHNNYRVDCRSDLYSLGMVLQQMLARRLPIAANIPEILQNVSNIVVKLIAKNPEGGYQTAKDLTLDLQQCLTNLGKFGRLSFTSGEYCRNLPIPPKLYGREEEVKLLLQSFARVTAGRTELFMITGAPGIGKSALIQEVRKSVIKQRGYFISGRFEQLQENMPYSAIMQALESLIKQLLLGNAASLNTWRHEILTAVGNNGQVLLEVLPSLQLIIGEQPAVPPLDTTEAHTRFRMVFDSFMQAIATQEHPLVMVIDDWQWADAASLNFLKMLLSNKAIKYLLVIGACRDDDAKLLCPVAFMIGELIENQTETNPINLEELQQKDIQLLLQDTLISPETELADYEELADFIYDKTQGNPFLVRRFLRLLYQNGHIWFDYNLVQWCWNIEASHSRRCSVNDEKCFYSAL